VLVIFRYLYTSHVLIFRGQISGGWSPSEDLALPMVQVVALEYDQSSPVVAASYSWGIAFSTS
jgi:hypothetical protein